jgi:DHA1 family tetracycline resistance protein-like MFS transporter
MAEQARGRRAAFGFIPVTVWLDVLSLGVIIPVYAPLIQRFEGGDAADAATWIGIFGAVGAAAMFVCAPILGSLSDRFGRRPVLLIALAGLGLDYLVMAAAPSLWWLLASRLVMGMTAASGAVANAYVADVTAPEKRAQTFGWLGAAWGLGFIIGPAIGGWLGAIDLRAPFYAAAGLTLLAALYGAFVLPESLAKENRSPFSWRAANPIGSLGFLRRHGELLALAGVNLFVQLAHNVLPTIFVIYASNRYGWSPAQTGGCLALIGIGNILVQGVMVRPVVARLGEAGSMLAGLVFGGLGFAIYGLAPTGETFLIGIPVFALIGLFGPGFQGLITRLVGANEQGQLQGANSSLFGLAGIVAPPMFAFTYAWFVQPGHAQVPGAAFLLAALLHVPALALALSVVGQSRRAARATA